MTDQVIAWLELQSRYGGGVTVATYKIEYKSGHEEEVEAAGWVDNGDWIDFVDGTRTQLLRILAGTVKRIERAKN